MAQSDLVNYTLLGLRSEYEIVVTTLTHIPIWLTFDDLYHDCCCVSNAYANLKVTRFYSSGPAYSVLWWLLHILNCLCLQQKWT